MIPLIARIFFHSSCNIYLFAVQNEIKFPEIVVKQYLAETEWGKCTDCSLELNNCFGFYTNQFLEFDHWIESVEFYKKFQDDYAPEQICDEDCYYDWLDAYAYASAGHYVSMLKDIKIIWN